MTDKEKAIVMAYTGACMLTGDKLQIFHKYVEGIMGRPIWTHEMAQLADEIKEKSKADFMALCADEGSSENPYEWIPVSERLPGFGQTVLVTSDGELYFEENGFGWCGQATTIAYLTEEGWELSDINYEIEMNKITAWQPLPEPYKGRKRGQ